jgi:hypothetical protein
MVPFALLETYASLKMISSLPYPSIIMTDEASYHQGTQLSSRKNASNSCVTYDSLCSLDIGPWDNTWK